VHFFEPSVQSAIDGGRGPPKFLGSSLLLPGSDSQELGVPYNVSASPMEMLGVHLGVQMFIPALCAKADL